MMIPLIVGVVLATAVLCSRGTGSGTGSNTGGQQTLLERCRARREKAAVLGWFIPGGRVACITIRGDLKAHAASADRSDVDESEADERPLKTRLDRDDDFSLSKKQRDDAWTARERKQALKQVRRLLASGKACMSSATGTIFDGKCPDVLLGTQQWVSNGVLIEYTRLLQERAKENNKATAFGLVGLRPNVPPEAIFADYVDAKFKMNALSMDIARTKHVYAIVHVNGNHWVLVAVDVATRSARVYDSLVREIAQAQAERRLLTEEEQQAVHRRMHWLLERVDAWLRAEQVLSEAVDRRLALRGVFESSSDFGREWTTELGRMLQQSMCIEVDEKPVYAEAYRWELPEEMPGSWDVQPAYDAPQQDNGIDCGVFAATLAATLACDGEPSDVCQEDMVVHRSALCESVMLGRLPGDTRSLRPIIAIQPRKS